MFNALDNGLVKSARRFLVVAVLAGAALSAHAITLTYTSPTVTLGGDTAGSAVGSLPKFNPAWGTLLTATIYTDAKATYSYSATNPETTAEPVTIKIATSSDVVVTDPVSSTVLGQAHASTGENTSIPSLGGGSTASNSGMNEDGPTFTAGVNLTDFIATPGNTTLTVNQDFSNLSLFRAANLNPLTASLFATSSTYVVYTYSAVPGPAAAGTMLIGFVGAVARRRRKA